MSTCHKVHYAYVIAKIFLNTSWHFDIYVSALLILISKPAVMERAVVTPVMSQNLMTCMY